MMVGLLALRNTIQHVQLRIKTLMMSMIWAWKNNSSVESQHYNQTSGFRMQYGLFRRSITAHSTLKLGGTITFPAGICSTMVSPSKSQRSHWESLASRAQGSSSTSRVFRPGFQQDNFTCIGLSHWARGSSTDLWEGEHTVTYMKEYRQWSSRQERLRELCTATNSWATSFFLFLAAATSAWAVNTSS